MLSSFRACPFSPRWTIDITICGSLPGSETNHIISKTQWEAFLSLWQASNLMGEPAWIPLPFHTFSFFLYWSVFVLPIASNLLFKTFCSEQWPSNNFPSPHLGTNLDEKGRADTLLNLMLGNLVFGSLFSHMEVQLAPYTPSSHLTLTLHNSPKEISLCIRPHFRCLIWNAHRRSSILMMMNWYCPI